MVCTFLHICLTLYIHLRSEYEFHIKYEDLFQQELVLMLYESLWKKGHYTLI